MGVPLPEVIVDQLQNALRRLTVATIVLYAVVVVVVVYFGFSLTAGIGRQADRLTKSLCNQRQDQVERVRSSKAFLKSHPNGAFGFTPAQIQDGITRSQKNIDALEPLDC